jgi:hypothetical protein
MPIRKEKTCMCWHGMRLITVGLGLFIFGLVKYLGYTWETAFMVIGVLAVLKGLLTKMSCTCK